MKKIYSYIYKLIFSICFAMYFTYKIQNYTFGSTLQIIFTFLYFFIMGSIIIYFGNRKFETYSKIYSSKYKIFIISLLGLIVISNLLLFNTKFFDSYDNQKIKVVALGEKNKLSNSSEVWITGIEVDGISMDLSNLKLPSEWELRDKAILSYKNQPKSIQIDIGKAKDVYIKFLTHDWSGKVQIITSKKTENIDLYSKCANEYKYQIKFEPNNPFIFKNIYIVISFAVIILFLSYFAIESFKNKQFISSILLYLFETFLFYKYYTHIDICSIALILLFTSIIGKGLFLNLYTYIVEKKYKVCRKLSIISLFFTILLSFMIWNFEVYHFNTLTNIVKSFLFFSCSIGLIFPIVLMYFSRLNVSKFIKIEKEIYISNKGIDKVFKSFKLINHTILYFLFPFIIWLVYFIGVFPGIMTPDSLDQWAQAHNVYQISDVHPAFHTLFIKVLIFIWDNPAILTLTQVITFSLVVFYFSKLLEKKGWSPKKIYIFIIIFSILPTNGMMVVTLWKDISYSISFLFFTYLLCEMDISGSEFFEKKLNIFKFFILSVLVWLFRHNGPLPIILTFIGLITVYWKEHKAKLAGIFICVIVTVNCVTGPLYKTFNVAPLEKGYGYQTFVHGLGAVLNNEKQLDKEDLVLMEKIMPVEEWKKLYYPYNVNNYLFNNKNYPYMKVISENTNQICKMYIKYLFRYPNVLIRDMLSLTNLVWSIYQPTDSYNYRYSPVVITDLQGLHSPKNLGINAVSSPLTKLIYKMAHFSHSNSIFDAIFWRFGICLYLILIAIYIIIKKKDFSKLIICLPFIGHTVSLLTMLGQDFKYVYPAYLSSWFIIAFIIYPNKSST